MEIKGTAVKSINDFVLKKFGNRYTEWFNSLSQGSKDIFQSALTNGWYPLKEGVVEPTEKIAELFYGGDTTKGALESGKHSAEVALNGVYKLYVRFSSPGHVVDRGSRILPAYYKPSKIVQIERNKQSVKFKMTDCAEMDQVVEYRIAGWMYKALEISGCKTMDVQIIESIKTHGSTVFEAKWN
ncbi:MAG: hypothetical protein PF517_15455 [Salinivirgaceae bacterium]|jgi:hypothetical protein|nr:hypothetical protein [Salinivirgaceae bacterium]